MNAVTEVKPEKSYKGWFWCHERQDYFRWNDLMTYYKVCELIKQQNNRKG